MHTMKKIKFFYLIIISSIFFYANLFSQPLKIGDENAQVTVKVFSSLTCPHCASFHKKVFKDLKKEYIDTKKIKFEHHAFPLDLAALNAEKVVRCEKNSENKFKLLGKIYEKQKKWAVGSDINKINRSLIKIGIENNLSENDIKKCLNNEESQEIILQERIQAQKKYNITSTPTIYINDKKYEDKHEFSTFKKELDNLL